MLVLAAHLSLVVAVMAVVQIVQGVLVHRIAAAAAVALELIMLLIRHQVPPVAQAVASSRLLVFR
jgi:hypothetical protein